MAGRSTALLYTTFALFAASAMNAAPARRLIVRSDDTPVRERCGDASPILARLPAGHELTLRFAIGGASQRCYAVWTRLAGEIVSGYIERDGVEGAGAFEQGLREASAARLVDQAIRTLEPSVVARYAFTLAQRFNHFYHQFPVMQEPDANLKAARVVLTWLFLRHQRAALDLMGIQAPPRM